jgi:hypothetical protein
MKLIASSVAILVASTLAAHAESFTFSGSAKITNEVGGPVAGGKPVGASFSDGSSKTVYASGKKANSTHQCAAWSASPMSIFSGEGMCVVTEGDGKFSVAFSCQNMDDKGLLTDCWGRLTGMTGSHMNKTGTASWRGTRSADGKSISSAGTGSWN